ncbi:MAG: hypothetical protein ACM3X3_07095 [Betaproteobacteria bacterium]
MIEIRLPKCWVLLTEREVESLLKRDPALWRTALERGKAVMRARARRPGRRREMHRKAATTREKRAGRAKDT